MSVQNQLGRGFDELQRIEGIGLYMVGAKIASDGRCCQ
jgi:hypothetical protein